MQIEEANVYKCAKDGLATRNMNWKDSPLSEGTKLKKKVPAAAFNKDDAVFWDMKEPISLSINFLEKSASVKSSSNHHILRQYFNLFIE